MKYIQLNQSQMIQTKAFIILSFICIGYLCNSQLIKQRGSESEHMRVNSGPDEIEEDIKTKISQNQGKQDRNENQISGNEENNIQIIQGAQQNLNLKNNAIKRNIRVSLNEESLLIISPPMPKIQVSQQNKSKQASQVKNVTKKKKKGKKSKKSKKSKKNKDKEIKNKTKEISSPQAVSKQIKQVVEKVEQKIVIQKNQGTIQKKVQPKIQQNKIEQKTSEPTTVKSQNIQKKENNQIGKNAENIPTQNPLPSLSENNKTQIIVNQTKVPQKENEIESENERMQRQKVIQQQIKTQQQLKKARDEIIFRRQEQINKLLAQAKKRAEENKPVEMVELKPYYCGPQIYQNRRRNLPQPVPNSRQRLVQTVYGFSMYVDSKDYMVSNSITASGTWQPGYINLIGHLVKPGNNVINLGSQSGLQALVMGKIVGKNGKLFIFEPYSFSNNLITKNIALNQLQDITTIYKYGASDEKTTAKIQIAYSNTGGSQIVPKETNAVQPTSPYMGYMGFNEVQQVEIDRVDALLPKDISLDFALLDVEKMEIKAMKGMKQIIQRSPNLVIMTEWQYGQNPRRNRQETIEFLNFMIGRGYKIYSYTGGNIVNCSVGQFHQYPNIQVLLGINFIDIFFFPKDYVLPQ